MPEDERLVRIEGAYIIFGGRPVFDIQLLNRRLSALKDQINPSVGSIIVKAA